MRSRSCVTMRGVKPLLMSARSLVCCGGSMLSIICRMTKSCSAFASAIIVPPTNDEYVALSRDTATTSS